jgi:hypothetical protein
MQLTLATAGGEQHGLINTLTNSNPFDEFKHMKPEHKKEMERQKKEDARIVQAEYLNSQGRHERLTKAYCKYSGDPIQIWHFIPGRVYSVPMGLVNEVNDKNKIMKQRSGLQEIDGKTVNPNGAPTEKDMDGDFIHKFISIGFNSAVQDGIKER